MTDRAASPQTLVMELAKEVPEPVAVDLGALFDQHFDYVWHTLRRLGVGAADLEDIAHDVFLVVHRHFHELDVQRPVRPWLFVFALRAASDYRRLARHRVDPMDDSSPLRDEGALPDELALARERLNQVGLALEALDLDRRAIFVLHEIDEVPIPEAAAAIGIPVNTAYSRLRLAREDFSSALRRIDGARRRRR